MAAAGGGKEKSLSLSIEFPAHEFRESGGFMRPGGMV
jgi:hypothetical protein